MDCAEPPEPNGEAEGAAGAPKAAGFVELPNADVEAGVDPVLPNADPVVVGFDPKLEAPNADPPVVVAPPDPNADPLVVVEAVPPDPNADCPNPPPVVPAGF